MPPKAAPIRFPRKYNVQQKQQSPLQVPAAQAFQTPVRSIGGVGAGLASISSFASGLAKGKLYYNQLEREQSRWEQDFQLRKQSADWAHEMAQDKLELEYEKHASEMELRDLQANTEILNQDWRRMQMGAFEDKKQDTEDFNREMLGVLGEIDMTDPLGAFNQLSNFLVATQSKFPNADTSGMKTFIDLASKSLSAQLSAYRKPIQIETAIQGRKAVKLVDPRNGGTVATFDKGEYTPGVQKILEDGWEQKQEIHKSAWDALKAAGALEKGVINIGAIEQGRTTMRRYRELMKIVDMHNENVREKILDLKDRLDKSLELQGVKDKEAREQMLIGSLGPKAAAITEEQVLNEKMIRDLTQGIKEDIVAAAESTESAAQAVAVVEKQIMDSTEGEVRQIMLGVIDDIVRSQGIDADLKDRELEKLVDQAEEVDPMDASAVNMLGESVAGSPATTNPPKVGDIDLALARVPQVGTVDWTTQRLPFPPIQEGPVIDFEIPEEHKEEFHKLAQDLGVAPENWRALGHAAIGAGQWAWDRYIDLLRAIKYLPEEVR